MANLNLSQAANMATDQIFYGNGTVAPTQITITDGHGTATYSGSFTYTASDIYGTIFSYQYSTGTAPLFMISALNLDAHAVLPLIMTSQMQSLFEVALQGANTFSGSPGNDLILAYNGPNTIQGNGGSDLVIGSAKGFDALVLHGDRSQYVITEQPGAGITVTDTAPNGDGTAHLLNVDYLQFADQGLVPTISAGTDTAEIALLYAAALGRAPDMPGLAAWVTTFANNVSAEAKAQGPIVALAQTPAGYNGDQSIAAGFTGSAEFQSAYGNLDNGGFVTLLYHNVLGRDPDPIGYAAWLKVLDAGSWTREMVLAGFAVSPENYAHVQAAGWLVDLWDSKTPSLTLYQPTDMATATITGGVLTGATPTQITATDGNDVSLFYGTFSYSATDVTGTVTGQIATTGSDIAYKLTNANIDVATAMNLLDQGQIQSLFQMALQGNTTIFGSPGDDVILTYDGNGTVHGGGGSDTMTAGGGFNTLVLHGNRSDYAITLQPGTVVTAADQVAGRDGTAQTTNFDYLSFADQGVVLTTTAGTDTAEIALLYAAALDRPPEVAGMSDWVTTLATYVPASAKAQGPIYALAVVSGGYDGNKSIAAGFTGSAEFQSTYGNLDNAGFIALLYDNVLGRAPDPAGYAAWLAALDNGWTREMVLVGFAVSAENYAHVQAAGWLMQVAA